MRHTLVLLIFLFSTFFVQAQLIDFQLISVDTHQSPLQEFLDEELLINNSSIFREAFRNSKYTINQPRFHQTIFLKRSIQEECLQVITNTVTIDSTKQTISWLTTLERGACTEKRTRHMVISIPRPPLGFEVVFDTLWTTADTSRHDQKITKLPLNSISCELTHDAGGPFYPLPAIITNDSLYLRYYLGGALSCASSVDFNSEIILANSYGGDCHMRLRPHTFFDPITNTLVLEVYNIWGRCRAGGRVPLAVVVPKPSQGTFKVVFQEIQVDSQEEYEAHINGKQ